MEYFYMIRRKKSDSQILFVISDWSSWKNNKHKIEVRISQLCWSSWCRTFHFTFNSILRTWIFWFLWKRTLCRWPAALFVDRYPVVIAVDPSGFTAAAGLTGGLSTSCWGWFDHIKRPFTGSKQREALNFYWIPPKLLLLPFIKPLQCWILP